MFKDRVWWRSCPSPFLQKGSGVHIVGIPRYRWPLPPEPVSPGLLCEREILAGGGLTLNPVFITEPILAKDHLLFSACGSLYWGRYWCHHVFTRCYRWTEVILPWPPPQHPPEKGGVLNQTRRSCPAQRRPFTSPFVSPQHSAPLTHCRQIISGVYRLSTFPLNFELHEAVPFTHVHDTCRPALCLMHQDLEWIMNFGGILPIQALCCYIRSV